MSKYRNAPDYSDINCPMYEKLNNGVALCGRTGKKCIKPGFYHKCAIFKGNQTLRWK